MRSLLALLLVLLGTACAGQPAAGSPGAGPAGAAAPGSAPSGPALPTGLIYLRGAAGGAIAALDARSGRLVRSLPDATPSPDWRVLYRLSPGLVEVVETATGRVAASHPVPMWARSLSVSGGGDWLVFQDPESSRFQVRDAGFRARPVMVSLPGRFTFDGISGDGRRLYLLEWVAAGRYQVRMYNLASGALSPQVISDKSEVGQLMSGQALSSLPTGDGAMQLTLYQRSAAGRAFVHALPLAEELPYAFCVDLPGPPQGWAFAAGPGGRQFYAVNPAGARLVRLSVAPGVSEPTPREGELGRDTPSSSALAAGAGAAPAAALSPDGATLYVASAQGLAAVDAGTLRERGRAALAEHLDALGVSPDGTALFALAGGTRLLRIDPRTLAVTGTIDLDGAISSIGHVT